MPKLAIDIEARFAQVIDGLDSIGKKADQQARSIEKSFKAAGVVLASVFSAAVISEQLSAFRSTLDSLADLDDAAAQAGTTVEKFSEAWLFLRPTGVSVEQLSGIVDTLFKQLSKGGKEGEKVAKALGEIGVKARDAAGNLRDPVVLLEEMAKGLAEFENDPNKVGLIYEILGKRAKDAIPILEDLAKKEGETARITTELASKSEELSNQFRAIEQVGDNLRINFLAAYIDDISTLTTKYLESTKAGAGFLESLVNIAAPDFRLDVLTTQLVDFRAKLAELNNPGTVTKELALFGITKPIAQQKKEAEEAIAAIEQQIARLQKVRALTFEKLPATDDWSFGSSKRIGARTPDDDKPKKSAKERETEAEKLQKWLDQQVNTAEKYNLLEQTAIKILEAKQEKNHGITDAIEEQLLASARMVVEKQKVLEYTEKQAGLDALIAQLTIDQERNVATVAQSYRDLIDPVEQYRKKLREITELEELNARDPEKGLNSTEAGLARESVLSQMAALEETKVVIDEIDEYAKNAAQSMQSHFADFLFDPFKDGLKGLAENFFQTLRRMTADALAANLMKALLGDYAKSGSVGGILGGLFSGAVAGSSTNSTGSSLRAIEGGADAIYGSAVPASGGFSQVVNIQSSATAGSVADIRRAVRDASLDAMAQSRKRNGMAAR